MPAWTSNAESPERVFLVDSSIYIFRAWHIFDSSISDRHGQPANAVFGFAEFLFQLISQVRPRHLACAFDTSQTDSWRKSLYPAYKANREPAPEELRRQFQYCRSLCRALGIAEFGSERYEADDIIGSLAARYRGQGLAVTVVSADKDLTQLVLGEHDQWWDFARGSILDGKGVQRQFGVRPNQIADMLALSGDKVDNIPGIPGVGYATAARILQKLENIESILANIDQISTMKFRGASRARALIAAHGHILPLNKLLTTVVSDLAFDEEPLLRWHGVDAALLESLAEELGFGRSFRQRLASLGG